MSISSSINGTIKTQLWATPRPQFLNRRPPTDSHARLDKYIRRLNGRAALFIILALFLTEIAVIALLSLQLLTCKAPRILTKMTYRFDLLYARPVSRATLIP